jgi:hypothetical protein
MLWKIILEFKNMILEENLCNKLRNSHDNFSGVRVSMLWDFLLEYPKTMKFRDLHRSLTWKTFLWPFLNLLDNFSEHGIRVFLENGLGSFQTSLILKIWDKPEVIKKFQKQFWNLVLKSYITNPTPGRT